MSSENFGLIDSHCHLDMLDDAPEQTVARAKAAGVRTMLTVCVELEKAESIVALSKIEGVFASVGQHPNSAHTGREAITKRIISVAKQSKKVIAVGETGLDFYRSYDNPPPEVQIESLEAHIEAALHLDLPLIIHARNADKIVDILACYPNLRFVMHCFGGDVEMARRCLDLGGFISFAGIITFKNAIEARASCEYVPIERMLIETDSPFLAPIPHRGKPNEPAYVRIVAEQVAQIKEITLQEVAMVTTGNFAKLFGVGAEI